jgi:hypothetical protein
MTLQDKFYNIGYNEYGFDYDECEKIADEFAIGFAEWIVFKEYHQDIWVKHNKTKELLELYKKEKGL